MSTTSNQLRKLFQHLDAETATVEAELDAKNDSPAPQPDYNHDLFVASLRLDKLNVNMDHARSILLDIEKQSNTPSPASSTTSLLLRRQSPNASSAEKEAQEARHHRSHLKNLNDRIQHLQQVIRTVQENEAERYKQMVQQQKTNELKQRRASFAEQKDTAKSTGVETTVPLTMDDKVAVQQNMQEELSGNILNMVSQIKQNAQTFNEKISEDKQVVEGASDALNKTSSSMGNVGTRLSKYNTNSALGWKFYLIAAVGMVLSLILGMTFINLFPKW